MVGDLKYSRLDEAVKKELDKREKLQRAEAKAAKKEQKAIEKQQKAIEKEQKAISKAQEKRRARY